MFPLDRPAHRLLVPFVLASLVACNSTKRGLPARDAGAIAFTSPTVACAQSEPACPSGTTCIAYGSWGREERACDVPCGAARECPTGLACTSYDDGPENVCRPLAR